MPNVKSDNGHKLNAGNSLTIAKRVEGIKEHEDLSQFVKIDILAACLGLFLPTLTISYICNISVQLNLNAEMIE